nr:reverse transcriptase domain-containing protein [Tanacetum cinerariifolium]
MNLGLKNDMIQQVQNSCQFHGLPGDDANKHLDKFVHVTQSIKVNGVTDDALRLYLFPHSLTHHATAWFDRLPRNSINTSEQMAKMFLAQRSESSSSITSSFATEIAALVAKMAKINKNLMRVLQVNQKVKADTPSCETCGGPHSFNDCLATVSQTQNVYAAGAYQGNSYQPQGNPNLLSYRSDNYLGPPGANQGQNQPPTYQAPVYQAPIHQPQIPQPKVVTTNEFTNFMKANDAILKNMQSSMTSLTNSNLELKNMFGQFMKMNNASSSGSETLPGNTITNPKDDLKGSTTRSGTAYQGPTIPTTSSSPIVEREPEATKGTVHPTNDRSTKDVQPSVVSTESPILNSEPVISLIIEPVASPNSTERTPLGGSPKEVSRKLGDPGKFLILCDFPRMAECLALADLGASINLMPLSVWKKLSLPDLSPTCMTLELVDRSISRPVGVAEVSSSKWQEVLDFFDVIVSGNPTPYNDPTVSTTSPTLTPFGNSDILLEEVDAFLALEEVDAFLTLLKKFPANEQYPTTVHCLPHLP